jgi:RNA polymerase sigma-70 factor (ECF subfamily)
MVESRIVSATDAAPPGEVPFTAPPSLGAGRREIDPAEISGLISKDYVGLRILIARRTGDPHVAADLLNDAVCTAWEKWRAGLIERPNQIAGYIFQVAMNLLRNRRRMVAERADRRTDLELLDRLQVSAEPEPHVEEEIARRVKDMIRAMDSQRDRVILVRFYLDEEDKESICRDLRLTPAQFDKVLHRARKRLRQLLESSGLRGSDFLSILCIV